jgi:hypothetical protein
MVKMGTRRRSRVSAATGDGFGRLSTISGGKTLPRWSVGITYRIPPTAIQLVNPGVSWQRA